MFYDSTRNVHENDAKNLSKHAKMERRIDLGKPIHPNCKWAKKHGDMYRTIIYK